MNVLHNSFSPGGSSDCHVVGCIRFTTVRRRAGLRIPACAERSEEGRRRIVAVRLVNKRTGKAVPDAVIAAKRIDMAPDGMADMAGRIEQLPSTEPGVYRFKANLSMQGSWQLSLAAKVQGENGTVESKLVLKVLP